MKLSSGSGIGTPRLCSKLRDLLTKIPNFDICGGGCGASAGIVRESKIDTVYFVRVCTKFHYV